MTTDLSKIRPPLGQVAPLTAFICWGYAVTNSLLGLGMFFLFKTPVKIAVANMFNYQVWGIIFGGVGLFSILALLVNNWKWTRLMQVAGLLIKSVWLVALIVLCLSRPSSILITLVWAFFAYIQAGVYIHFLPEQVDGK